jgi:hypothetical protein
MEIGTRVRLTQDVDNYPTCLIHAGETGTLTSIDGEGAYWVRLDQHHPELSEWDNEVQTWGWSVSFTPKHRWRKCREGLGQEAGGLRQN